MLPVLILEHHHYCYDFLLLTVGVRQFTPHELTLASSNFSELVGKGGFGKVYRGVFHHQAVAIKQLDSVIALYSHMYIMERIPPSVHICVTYVYACFT